MSIKQIQIKVQDLTLGMYVSGLDRPWSQTPYPLQGFHVRNPKDVETLKAYCQHVYIDVTKGRGPLKPSDIVSKISHTSSEQVIKNSVESVSLSVKPQLLQPKPPAGRVKLSPIPVRLGVYETTSTLRIEASKAERIVKELKANLNVSTRLVSKGKPVDFASLKKSTDSMVASVLRCPDAFTWLLRIRQKDQHTHDHALRSALWAIQFARYIGMEKEQINILCLGTLLKDVGKVTLPDELLRKKKLSAEEQKHYRTFVDEGVEMLRSVESMDPKVLSVVRYHCERMDGSGFPQGVLGNKIPLLARIAGIATVYDAISNPREAKEPMAPSKAVSLLYNMRDTWFQEDIVVNFIQSIGLYPTGTVVELTTGDLAVVMDQHPKSRLTPKVAVLDPLGGNLNENCVILDLKDQEACLQKLIETGHQNVGAVSKLAIARDLEPTGYDIDYKKISRQLLDIAPEAEKEGVFASLKRKLMGQ